jgi:hypothetical protein
VSEKETQGPYPYPVPGPSQDYNPYPPWFPPEVYYARVWSIVSCMLTKLNRGVPTVAYPGDSDAKYPALLIVGATATIVTGQIASISPETFERLIHEHPDLYEQCACELYPDDRALCKKEG